MDLRLDEYVTLHVRAQHRHEARGKAFGLAASFMPGEFALGGAEIEEARQEPDYSDLWAIKVYPAPKGL